MRFSNQRARICCGSPGAYFMMMYRAINPSVAMPWGIFHVLERSTLERWFLTSGQNRHVRPTSSKASHQRKITEGRRIEFCRDLETPASTQRHVTALNQISGTRFGSIKKLAALRQKQSQYGKNPS
jgi:hypothetical protein